MSSRRTFALALVLAGCGSVQDEPVAVDSPPGTIDTQPGIDAKQCDAALDQQLGVCQQPPISQCTEAFINTSQFAAQVFTPTVSGSLAKLRLRMRNDAIATNQVRVRLVDLDNNAMALADGTFSLDTHTLASIDLPMTATEGWQEVVFAQPPTVAQNLPYAIVVSLLGTPVMGRRAYWNLYNDFQGLTDSYTRGRSFACTSGCATWTAEPDYRDQAFEAYIAPLTCP